MQRSIQDPLPLDEASSVINAHKHAARSAAMTQI